MIIEKIFNNNVVLASDTSKTEYVILGKGIAFQKKVGDYLDDKGIEKKFVLDQGESNKKISSDLSEVSASLMQYCYDVIDQAKTDRNMEFNDYIYITLTDHIYHVIQLYRKGIRIPNTMTWEIKKHYINEYEIALEILERIEEEMGICLNEEEAANIALHLLNAELNFDEKSTWNARIVAEKIKDIVNIVRRYFKKELKEDSPSFERFLVHLKFFFQRVSNGDNMLEIDTLLTERVKELYPESYHCMEKIERYLGFEVNESEKIYLTLHIQRVLTDDGS